MLDEWEKMRDPNYQAVQRAEVRPAGAEEAARDITRDSKVFTAAIRQRIFSFLRGLVNGEYEQALAHLDSPGTADGEGWTAEKIEATIGNYYAEHERICLDANARNLRHTYILPSEDKKTWKVQQMLVDPEQANDWLAEFEIDLAASRAKGEPVVLLKNLRHLV